MLCGDANLDEALLFMTAIAAPTGPGVFSPNEEDGSKRRRKTEEEKEEREKLWSFRSLQEKENNKQR